MTSPLADFAAEVGSTGPVTCVGGRTQWSVGGRVDDSAREVTPPQGVVTHEPAEMVTRVRAGTNLAELQKVLAEGGQYVTLESDDPQRSTVGGVLSVGRGGVRRLGWGPPRDAVLEVTAVNARGELIRAGAPLVKNVTGFDLCRLLTGSLGTLAFIAEVVLRCRPKPEVESWWRSEGADPFALLSSLYRPMSVLWDGTTTWVGLEGYRVDIDDQARLVLGPTFDPVDGPPARPGAQRVSLSASALLRLKEDPPPGSWLAELGVGVLHCGGARPTWCLPAGPDHTARRLNETVKANFDPTGRLNPGRDWLAEAVGR